NFKMLSKIEKAQTRPFDMSRIRRILIRYTNWVGDAVMALPALEAVRDNFPESEITVVGRPWITPLLESHPAVDRILSLNKKGRFTADLIEILRLVRHIRRIGFDLAFLFQNAFEAAFIARLGGIPLRIGYDTDGRGFLLSHAVSRDKNRPESHQVDYYIEMLKALGLEARGHDPRLYVSAENQQSARSLLFRNDLGDDDFLVGLSPGAAFGPAKRWPTDRFADVGDRAVEAWRAKVLIFGSRDERDIGEKVRTTMKHDALDLCGGTSLGEVMALISRCRLFVTNDSGLMHIASALSVPTVAVFGSTNPVATGPRSQNAVVIQHKTECSPCLKPRCPGDFGCMLGVEADQVWNELLRLKERL
ncbi:MAG: lipopolysaccharide heptosyltransferase II, partial [Desulfatiglandales bacterium]